MCKGYLINDVLEFWPDKNTLVARGDEKMVVTMNVPTSRCFQLLLDKRHTTISQNEFFEFVWGESGALVPANTLYQNVSLLRKALRSALDSRVNWVVTVPKQGFKLSDDLVVSDIESEEEMIPKVSELAAEKKGTKRNWSFYIFSALFLIGLSAILYYAFSTKPFGTSYYDKHTQVETINGCHIYANDDAIDYSMHLNAATMIQLNCPVYPYVYITAYKIIPTVSMVSCDKPLSGSEKNIHCTSYVLRGVNLP